MFEIAEVDEPSVFNYRSFNVDGSESSDELGGKTEGVVMF